MLCLALGVWYFGVAVKHLIVYARGGFLCRAGNRVTPVGTEVSREISDEDIAKAVGGAVLKVILAVPKVVSAVLA